MLNKLKSLFQKKENNKAAQSHPEIVWVSADANPWKIRVLDVRPVTQHFLSTSKDPSCAQNAISYGNDDGLGFVDQKPEGNRRVPADISFHIDRVLAPGALFIPREMEHKWALYFHNGRILCIRSWIRKVAAIGHVEIGNDGIGRVTSIQGSFTDDDEEAEFTGRTMDYLIRSHALGLPFPAPLPKGLEASPYDAAMWCMSLFGRLALCATPDQVRADRPEKPLRTHSLLHIGVARGDKAAVEQHLQSGMPIDLLAADGLPPLHWAFARRDTEMAEFLISRGSSVDVLSSEGATPLMTVVQSGHLEKIRFLIDQKANINAVDKRGFTVLHRAAELGKVEVVKLLIDNGANPNIVAEGYTPISFAEKRGHTQIIDFLRMKTG